MFFSFFLQFLWLVALVKQIKNIFQTTCEDQIKMHYTCCRNAYGGWCFLLPSKKSQHRLTLIIFSSILLRTRTNCCYERGVFATCDCRKWDVTEISRRGLLLKNVVVFTSKPRNWTSLFFLGRQTAEKAALPYDAAQSHVRLSHVYLVVFFISALTVLLYATVFIWLCVWFFFPVCVD